MADSYDEVTEASWIEELNAFKDNVWPTFERMGFKFGEAYQTYTLNVLKNSIYDLIDEIRESKI